MPETITPESETINEMETPVELEQDEMTDSRYSYDLPKNDVPDSSAQSTVETDEENENGAPEEESQSEIPGDPRDPHQTQPPTEEQC